MDAVKFVPGDIVTGLRHAFHEYSFLSTKKNAIGTYTLDNDPTPIVHGDLYFVLSIDDSVAIVLTEGGVKATSVRFIEPVT